MEEQGQITIQGTLESITFRAESGFTVGELDCGGELVTIVGELLGVEVGEELNQIGRAHV